MPWSAAFVQWWQAAENFLMLAPQQPLLPGCTAGWIEVLSCLLPVYVDKFRYLSDCSLVSTFLSTCSKGKFFPQIGLISHYSFAMSSQVLQRNMRENTWGIHKVVTVLIWCPLSLWGVTYGSILSRYQGSVATMVGIGVGVRPMIKFRVSFCLDCLSTWSTIKLNSSSLTPTTQGTRNSFRSDSEIWQPGDRLCGLYRGN